MQDHQDRNTHKGKQNNHKGETKIKQKTQDLLLLELDNDAQDLINLSHLLDKENQNNEKKNSDTTIKKEGWHPRNNTHEKKYCDKREQKRWIGGALKFAKYLTK